MIDLQELRKDEDKAFRAFVNRINEGVLPAHPKVPVIKLAQRWVRAAEARKAAELSNMMSLAAKNAR